jgi:uroporphyrinogen-III synthase
MLDRAVAWKNSTAPEGYDKSAVLKNLKKLVKGSKEINKLVKKNASDKELKEELTELHDVFHEIVEKCEKGEHH